MDKLPQINKLIQNKYQIESELGKGKFGKVYKGKRIKDQENIAIKIESDQEYKILKHETTILNYLHNHKAKSIPTVFWYGIYEKCPTLVMSYYQNSLEDYIKYKPITQEKLDLIMNLILEILENVHKHYVIHRDIKPQNIMMKNGELFLIDFGLSTFYMDEDFNHVECKQNKEYILGTPKYISYNIHCGYEPSRRDDLISLGYMYMDIQLHCLHGLQGLPWSNIDYPSSNETNAIINQERKRLKSWPHISELCSNLGTPLNNYMKRCYELAYKEVIEYNI